jgi:hypothetical protein
MSSFTEQLFQIAFDSPSRFKKTEKVRNLSFTENCVMLRGINAMKTDISETLSGPSVQRAVSLRIVIRKGQRKPYVKATRKQIEQRIEAAALLKFCGLSKCNIHRVFRERYGVEWRQTDRYMARARA